MAGLLSRRFLWLLGCFPLLSTDFAVGFSLSQISVSQQVSQDGDDCSLDAFQAGLTAENWHPLVDMLSSCDVDDLEEVDRLAGLLQDVVQVGSEQQQIVALYGLRELEEKAANLDVTTGFVDWLVDLLAEDNSLMDASQAIAVDMLGIFAAKSIEEAEPAVILGDDSAPLDFVALVEKTLLPLTSSEGSSLRLQIAASEALRDIGYALQEKMDFVRFRENETVWQGERTWADNVLMTLEDNILNALEDQSSSELIQDNVTSTQQRLLTAAQIAKVEALSAFLFLSSSNAVVSSEDVAVNQLCLAIPDSSVTNRGIQFLNCLSAQEDWETPAGETVEIDTLVRAAALAEFERLGTLSALRDPLAEQLRLIALVNADQTLFDNDDRERHTNDWTNTGTNIRISAVESMSRVERLPDAPRPVSRSLQEQQEREQDELARTREYRPSFSDTLKMLVLLADGLDSSDLEEEKAAGNDVPELQQRAEIAFDQIYDRNLDQLAQAARYSGGSGNTAIQRNAVQALGAVNYARLSDSANPDDLAAMAQFLGQSLLCADNAEVRRDAAFALGQLAPHYPELLDEPLGSDWERLLPETPPVSLGKQLMELCDAAKSDANTNASITPKVIDALVLRLSDREQNIVVAAAYALSRYSLALDSDIKEANFLGQTRDEQKVKHLNRLKACMKVLISPTRFDQWPDEMANDPMYAPLITTTERYVDDCQSLKAENGSVESTYLLPEQNRNESAIAAAFVLGRVGISDGNSEASNDEQETVDYLLRSLRGRDLLRQRAVNDPPPRPRPPLDDPPQVEYPYRPDSVRDSIVSYIFGQIHPREHGLITALVTAVIYPDKAQQPSDLPEEFVERAINCADSTRSDDLTEVPVCIDDPITRASVLGAVEVIGLESLRSIEETDPRHAEQRQRVEEYLINVRQLLTQDVNPVLTEAVVNTVVERIMALTPRADETASGSGSPLANDLIDNANRAPSDSDLIAPLPERDGLNSSPKVEDTVVVDQFGAALVPLQSIHQNIAATRYTLALPFTSLYSCAGSAYGLARLGVYNDATVNQLVNYLFVYPEPLSEPGVTSTEFGGYFCMPSEPPIGDEQTSEELPSQVEQLVILKTGAIAALGAIGLYDAHHVDVYPRDAIRRQANLSDRSVEEVLDVTPEQIEQVVTCLINIANLEVLALDEDSFFSCKFSEELEAAATDSPLTHTAIPDSELSIAERSQARRAGLRRGVMDSQASGSTIIEAAQAWGLTLDEILQAREWGISFADMARIKLEEVSEDYLEQGFDNGLPISQLIDAWQFGLKDIDKILAGRRQGLLVPEVIQAAKWGVTPQEFFTLKRRCCINRGYGAAWTKV